MEQDSDNPEEWRRTISSPHFIKAIDTILLYCSDRLFGEDDPLLSKSCIRTLDDDYSSLFASKCKSDHFLPTLPDSLKRAIYYYLLARGVRRLEGDYKTSIRRCS